MEKENKRKPIVRISYNELEAYILLPMVSAEESYSVAEVMEALTKSNVRYGVDQDKILEIIKDRIFGREVLVATGTPVVDGKDAFFKYKFNTDFNKKPTVREDGSVDYWSIHAVEIVEEGQVIAIYNEPVDGENGMTVTGKVKVAKRGRPLPPLVGKGFERSEDGLIYTASVTGKIEMNKNRIMISTVYEVYGNVDLQTGNIDFRGDVIIHGNVTTGAKIKATGSITIDGTAEGCQLNAGKDIILRGGMIGGEKARIHARGNISAKFIEYSTVEAEGFIEATSAMNSTIVSYDKVFFNGRFASVVGGSVSGCAGIEANNFGNSTEIKTEICVGVHAKIRQRLRTLQMSIDDNHALVDKLNLGIQQFDEIAREKNIDGRNDERRVSLLRTRIAKQAEIASDSEELVRLNSIIERSRDAKVIVYNTVYPGVEVCINDSKAILKDEHSAVEFVERGENVVMMSIQHAMVL